MSRTITGIVEWLENWFYKKEDVNTYLNAKANKNLTNANMNVVTDSSGNITTEAKPTIPDVSGFIDTAGTGLSKSGTTLNHSNTITAQSTAVFKKFKYDGQGHITGTANVDANDIPAHYHSANYLIDQYSDTYSNIGLTTSWAEQGDINSAINTTIGNLQSIKAIEVVSTLPTASSSTMGKLYIISENSKVNVYYTKQSGSTYSWQKMDTDILDELSIDWTDITGRPTKTSDFTNDGADGTNVYVANNDSRLSDARTPTSHSHGQVTNDGKITSTAVTVASGDNIVITDASDSSKLKRVANLLSDHIQDGTAHSNIGSSANATQSTINSNIDTALSNKASSTHVHGQITNSGAITSTAVTVASQDSIVITDYSDSSKIKRVDNLLTDHIKDGTAHSHIGSSANATQSTINSAIDTALSNKSDTGHTHSNYVTSIALVPKATDSSGAITLYYGDEPT